MHLPTAPYLSQAAAWPASGRVILASFDDTAITVYQAFRPSIGHFAARHGRFGGEYRFSRMTWIKPNFLWMMSRSGWGTKLDQEVTLALRVRRDGFEALLAAAVASSFQASEFVSPEAWRAAVAASDVRLQWDPDHDPWGRALPRRAVQLGLRGELLRRFHDEWLLDVTDISAFVAEQREHLSNAEVLRVPAERVYDVKRADVAARFT